MQSPIPEELPDTNDTPIEHLVTWQEDGGQTLVLGLDVSCRPVYLAALDAG